jgi:methylmalonyl-CoA mutase
VKNRSSDKKLFSEFPPVSRAEWEELITSDLKGSDYKEKLKWETLEGISPLPFYMCEDTDRLPPIQPENDWIYCEPIFDREPEKIRQSIENAYERGALAFQLTSRLSTIPNQTDGTSIELLGSHITGQEDFSRIFRNVDTKEISLFLDTGIQTPIFSAMIQNQSKSFLRTVFIHDPITESVALGKTLWDSEAAFGDHILQAGSLAADALFYHKAGCTIASEVAIAISIASEYLSALPADDRESFARSFLVRLSAGPLYFPEIAKFRALRLLWKNLLEAYDMDSGIPVFIHAESTLQNKSAGDPHNNMLRSTTEAMAAAIGGADSLTLFPYDASFSIPDNFSSRIAGNIQHILKEESHLNVTADPSAGSYYIENLTQEIAEKAWEQFAACESRGGFLKDAASGALQETINSSRRAKENAYATRKRVLTGNNNYPANEKNIPDKKHTFPVTRIPEAGNTGEDKNRDNISIPDLQNSLESGAATEQLWPALFPAKGQPITPIQEFHAADIFDSIRRKTKELVSKTGKEVNILILPAGNIKWRNARSSFAQNLLGCAGFNLQTADGGNTIDQAMEKLEIQKFDVVVLCGSDKEYPEMAGDFCSAMSDQDRILILAGQPGDREKQYRDSGIDEFIWAGMNAAEFLSGLQSELYNRSEKP